jgi:hypothetical protein
MPHAGFTVPLKCGLGWLDFALEQPASLQLKHCSCTYYYLISTCGNVCREAKYQGKQRDRHLLKQEEYSHKVAAAQSKVKAYKAAPFTTRCSICTVVLTNPSHLF